MSAIHPLHCACPKCAPVARRYSLFDALMLGTVCWIALIGLVLAIGWTVAALLAGPNA